MKKYITIIATLLICFLAFATAIPVAAEQDAKENFSVMLVNGSTSVFTDRAEYDGEDVKLSVYASNGYGTRANFSALGKYQLLDVKNFSTELMIDVPLGMSTVFSLQTVDTGTIGSGEGNGIYLLFRKDSPAAYTIAVYNQEGTKSFFAKELCIIPDTDGTVRIEFLYEESLLITVSAGETMESITVPGDEFERVYGEKEYKGYYSVSAYYMTAVKTGDCVYTVKSVNSESVVSWEKKIAEKALADFEDTLAALGETPSAESVKAVKDSNAFDRDEWIGLISSIDLGQTFYDRLDLAQKKLVDYIDCIEYEIQKANISAFADLLDGYGGTETIVAAKEAYDNIDRGLIASLSTVYKNELEEKIASLRTKGNYKKFARDYASDYLAFYENSFENGKLSDLKTYAAIKNMVAAWGTFKEAHGLSVLSADEIASLDQRAKMLSDSVSDSVYSTMWREGESWNAEMTENGLYVSGDGKYGETLGFYQKLEVGKNTEITFNVIYALRKLGANHLHIGFYPKTNVGTMNDVDGVRVDFWFSGTSIEIKPVNGRTELPVYDSAYITIQDAGFFDPEVPDFDMGKYTVKLLKNGDTLYLSVNGYEMDLTGLDASLYADGCYITVSAMSIANADQNELVITHLGDTDYPTGDDSLNGNGKKNDNDIVLPVVIVFVAVVAVGGVVAIILIRRKHVVK